MMKFYSDYGMLQASDLDPASRGLNTQELTRPEYEVQEEITQTVLTGNHAFGYSPMIFILAIAALLIGMGYLQK